MSVQRTVLRGGEYYRMAAAPDWIDPSDTAYSKRLGGRWNPTGEFGALYLTATIEVAAANARARHSGRAIKLFDLLPEALPQLATFDVPPVQVLDACTSEGVANLGFAANFPFGVTWPSCQAIAREAHAAGLAGVAARSNAEATANRWVGEELAVFEQIAVKEQHPRRGFHEWYPDPFPE